MRCLLQCVWSLFYYNVSVFFVPFLYKSTVFIINSLQYMLLSDGESHVCKCVVCVCMSMSQSLLTSPPRVVLVDTYIIFLKLSWHLSTLYSYNWLLKNLFNLKKTQILLGCAECMHILRDNLCLCNIKLFHPGLYGTFKVLHFCSKPSYFPC